MGEEQHPLKMERAVCDSFMVLCSQPGAPVNIVVGCIFWAWGRCSGWDWNIVLGARLAAFAYAASLWTQELSLRACLPHLSSRTACFRSKMSRVWSSRAKWQSGSNKMVGALWIPAGRWFSLENTERKLMKRLHLPRVAVSAGCVGHSPGALTSALAAARYASLPFPWVLVFFSL